MSEFDIEIGGCIKRLRVDNGLTQLELAEKSGVTRQAIVSIEGGKRRLYVHEAMSFAKVFGVPVENVVHPAKDVDMDVFDFIVWRLDYNATDMGEIGKYVRWEYVVNYINEAREKYSDSR